MTDKPKNKTIVVDNSTHRMLKELSLLTEEPISEIIKALVAWHYEKFLIGSEEDQ